MEKRRLLDYPLHNETMNYQSALSNPSYKTGIKTYHGSIVLELKHTTENKKYFETLIYNQPLFNTCEYSYTF